MSQKRAAKRPNTILADGEGVVAEFNDCDGMASAISRLVEGGPMRAAALAAAQRYASGASWPAAGQNLLTVRSQARSVSQSPRVLSSMPVLSFRA